MLSLSQVLKTWCIRRFSTGGKGYSIVHPKTLHTPSIPCLTSSDAGSRECCSEVPTQLKLRSKMSKCDTKSASGIFGPNVKRILRTGTAGPWSRRFCSYHRRPRFQSYQKTRSGDRCSTQKAQSSQSSRPLPPVGAPSWPC